MELRQLEHFVAVAEERNFTRAARRTHIVQSGLSASVRALERDLGTQLLVRTTRRVELTEAGRALLEEARRVLAAAVRARDAVAAVEGVERGHLSIGVMQVHAVVDLPAVLGRFRDAHPGVEVRLSNTSTAEMTERVRDRDLDLAIVAWPGAPPRGVHMTPLVRQRMVLVCPPHHRLARRASIDLADLAGEPTVDFPPGWGVRMAIDRAFAAAGVERRIALEAGDTQTLVDLVVHGLGPAILPEWLGRRAPSLRLVPFRRRAPLWEESVVTADGAPPSPAARAFLDALLAATRGDPGAG